MLELPMGITMAVHSDMLMAARKGRKTAFLLDEKLVVEWG